MRDIRSALPIGLAVVVLAAVGCGDGTDGEPSAGATTGETSTAGLPKLVGRVGSTDDPETYEISLATEDGAEVTTILPPGRYLLEINDLSTIHNFHLSRRYGGLDVATEVTGTGKTKTVVVLPEAGS